MWLPAPLYASLPYIYVLCGALFFFGTLYIGVTAPGATLYVATGLICIVYGFVVFMLRHTRRASTEQFELFESAA